MARRTGLGQVGLGQLGRLHADNIARRIASAELVRVVDTRETVARAVGSDLEVDWSTSYDDLLSDSAIEGIVIATPPISHADLIVQAAAAGKHVFTEKPIALDQAETVRAIEATTTAGVVLQVGFHRRFDPDWAAARARIVSGELGDVYFFRTSQRDMWTPPDVDFLSACGSMFVDGNSHDFDLARWMVGEIDEVTTLGASLSHPIWGEVGDVDNAVMTLRFACGALGVIDTSRVAGYGYEASTEVVGSRASVRVDHHRRVHLEWLTEGSASFDYVADYRERFAVAYVLELEAFAKAIRHGEPSPVSGSDALAVFVLTKAAEHSLATGRSVQMEHQASDDGVAYGFATADVA